MKTIHLTPQNEDALKKFLERTELRGWEVPEFLALVKAVNSPPQPVPKTDFSDPVPFPQPEPQAPETP